MEFTVAREEDIYIFDVKVPKGKVDKEFTELALSIQPRANLKGFRKGKVPLEVIKSQYNKAIKAEISTKLVTSCVAEILEKEKIKNGGTPILLEEFRPTKVRQHVGHFGLDGTLKFKVSVEAPPEIDIKDYIGLDIDIDVASDFDSWVKTEVFKQQMAFGDKVNVKRKCKPGDEVVADFIGSMDGVAFEGGTEDDYMFVIGSGDFVPGFEEGFVGRMPGDEFITKVTFPIDYPQKYLAGKGVEFACILKEVWELTPHPLDNTLASMLSYDSVEDMMDRYKEMWETEFEKPLRAKLFNEIMDKLILAHPFKIPNGWLEQETQLTMARMGIKPEDITDKNDILNSLKDISERSVRTSFILDKIYEAEKDIHVTAEEIEIAANKEATQHGKTGMEYLAILKKQNQYDAYISYQEQQKTIDFLIDSSNIKENTDEQ